MRGMIGLALALTWAQAALAAPGPGELAERYVAVQLALDPMLPDVSGLPGPRDRLPDLSAAAIDRGVGDKSALLRQVAAIDPAGLSPKDRRTWAVLNEALEADLGLRVCRQELWSLNHFFGWQFAFPQAAGGQPVETAADRAAALARWSSLPAYLDQDRANLEAGLAAGYSVPKTVARRVVAQLDALLAVPPDRSPFASPGARSADPAFRAQMTDLVRERINPALRAYRDFLETAYVPRARDTYGLSALPDGAACYRASLRYFITLPTSPEAVAAMGARTVARNAAEIGEIGARLFGERDVRTIVLKAKQAPANRLASPQAALAYSRARLAINEAAARKAIAGYPPQAVVIDPLPVSVTTAPPPHYEPEPDPAKPGRYVLPLSEWRTMTRGKAEWLAVHEAVPGHHVQMSSAFQRSSGEPIDRVAVNAAFTEGWARYSETLAEELGLFATDFGRIERRAWPGHGQELDVGVHVGGWSTARAMTYLTSTGVDDEASAAAMLDRISVFPGQLTAYDTGAAEILALREEGRTRLGARFDLGRFHRAVLEQGAVPLTELRAHVRAWIAAEAEAAR